MPFVPPQFSDFGKQISDLFKKKFDYGNNISTINKTDDGLKVEAGGKAKANSTDFDGYAKINYDGHKAAKFEGNINTNGAMSGKMTLNDLIDGGKVVVKTNDNPSGSVEASYAQDFFAGSTTFSTNSKAHKLNVSGAIGHEGLSVGASVDLDLSGKVTDPLEYNIGTQYATNNYTACLLTSQKGETVAASFFQRVNKSLTIGTRFTFKPEQNSRTMEFASEYALDAVTTVKAKADTNNNCAVAVEHKLSDPKVKVGVAAAFDSSKNFSNKNFGLNFTFGDF